MFFIVYHLFFITGDNMNLVLNENWDIISKELLPSFEEAYGILVKHFIQQFLDHVPENKLLLE